MTVHLHLLTCTNWGVAANNRGENVGNKATLPTVPWKDGNRSVVKAPAVRFCIRQNLFQKRPEEVNRQIDDEGESTWMDPQHEDADLYLDEFLLGTEGVEDGSSHVGMNPMVSIRERAHEVIDHFSTPGAQSGGGDDPRPYSVETHSTAYDQLLTWTLDENPFGVEAYKILLDCIMESSRVGGAHARYLFDYSPQAVVARFSHEPATRINSDRGFEPEGKKVTTPLIEKMIEVGDLNPDQMIAGGLQYEHNLDDYGVETYEGIKNAFGAIKDRVEEYYGK